MMGVGGGLPILWSEEKTTATYVYISQNSIKQKVLGQQGEPETNYSPESEMLDKPEADLGTLHI